MQQEINLESFKSGFGYSVDNIIPATPLIFSAVGEDESLTLNWNYVTDIDFGYHQINW